MLDRSSARSASGMPPGESTTASTSRPPSIRRRAPSPRQLTTVSPPRGRVRRSAWSADRLSSTAATAATSLGGAAERRHRVRGGGVRFLPLPGPPLPGPRTARPDRDEGPHHLARPLQDAPGIVVAEGGQRLLQGEPL